MVALGRGGSVNPGTSAALSWPYAGHACSGINPGVETSWPGSRRAVPQALHSLETDPTEEAP